MEENTRRSLDRRQALRRWLHRYKRDSDGCTRCDVTAPACPEFHHRSDEPKTCGISRMVPQGYGRDAIRAEIERCDLVCANCHRQAHATRPDGLDAVAARADTDRVTPAALPAADETEPSKRQRLRAWTAAYQRDRGCRRCAVVDPRCLQYNHVTDAKDAGVGAMISNSRPVADVLAEIENCVVLCANCHRLEHDTDPTAD